MEKMEKMFCFFQGSNEVSVTPAKRTNISSTNWNLELTNSPVLQPQCLACLAGIFGKSSWKAEEGVAACLGLAQGQDPR